MENEQYVTVTALTKYIKRKFDYDPHLRDIYIKGEISNFKRHSSGHMYFTLKDEKARISAVMFAKSNASLLFEPENGMKVIVRGEVSVFEQSGNYQVYAREMHADGIGDLFVAYEQLKERLAKENLFSPEHKKDLPAYPDTIAVITSPTGAAVRDMLITMKRRYPMGNVLLFPALVQGPQAPQSIVQAIQAANRHSGIDVLIVGRGGGSIEELWAFNDEAVARAIFASDIPVISAVGHETDTTIADYVADVRAATPTAAAELAVPDYVEMKRNLAAIVSKMTSALSFEIKHKETALKRLDSSYAFRYPERLYEQKVQQLDRMLEALHKESKRYFGVHADRLQKLRSTLGKHHPKSRIETQYGDLLKYQKQMTGRLKAVIEMQRQKFINQTSKLHVLNPLSIMERGYSITFDSDKNVIKSKEQVKTGDNVTVILKDGQILCEVKELKESVIDG